MKSEDIDYIENRISEIYLKEMAFAYEAIVDRLLVAAMLETGANGGTGCTMAEFDAMVEKILWHRYDLIEQFRKAAEELP